ncbi:MAG: hypothetical protein GQ583_01520 [Methyloprofundus sp.]|nr:hypothetical protein [Methyloprofundus sp.]
MAAQLEPSSALNRLDSIVTDIEKGDSLYKADLRYGVMIADIGFLIAQNTASEIIEGIEVYPLPNSARCMAGLINLRGNVVPVFDLNLVLNTASAETKNRLLLVLGEAEHAVGIYIEQLPQAINKSVVLTQRPPIPLVLEKFVNTAYLAEENIWLDFDYVTLFKALAAGE